MGTLTTNYLFQKPTDGGDPDVWALDYASGDPMVDPSPGLNGNWEKADRLFQDALTRLQAIDDLLDGVPEAVEQARIPVGGLVFFTTEVDVAALYGYGTWQLYAQGRVLVGEGGAYVAGAEGGVSTVSLTWGQTPVHNHTADPPNTTSSSAGSHTHSNVTGATGSGFSAGSGSTSTAQTASGKTTGSSGSHAHTLNVGGFNSSSVGGSSPHENKQPSKTGAVYRRTA